MTRLLLVRPGAAGRAALGRALPVLVLVGLFDVAVATPGLLAARLYAACFLLVVPGLLLVALTPLRPRELAVRIGWAVGASALLLMVLGVAYSELLPGLGIARPLSAWPVAIGVDAVSLAALAVHAPFRDPLDYLLLRRSASRREVGFVALAALLPLAAIAGAERLNDGAAGGLALAVLVVTGLAFAALVAVAPRLQGWMVGGALYSACLACLLALSMRSNYPFGFDIQAEYHVFSVTARAGAWHVPPSGNAYAAMLSITVLPAVLSATTHISGLLLFKALYPFVFALFPVLTYAVSVRWFSRRAALVGPIIVIGQGLFAADITGLARQEIGLVYFALLVATVYDHSLPRRTRQVAAVAAFVGMSITHYSTAYFAATVTVFGYAGYALLRLLQRRWRERAILSLPVVVLGLGAMLIWNVSITHSAQNVGAFAAAIENQGLQLLPGGPGSSILDRFLAADVTQTAPTPAAFDATASEYYAENDPWINRYPSSLIANYPVEVATVPPVRRPMSPTVGNLVDRFGSLSNELILFATVVGALAFLWRERRGTIPERGELAAAAVGTVLLLGLLRTSGTVSTYYNAPRGQVQGAVLLSVGLALALGWLFENGRLLAGTWIGLTAVFLMGVIYYNAGLLAELTEGSGAPTLNNAGESYQRFYISDAEVASARWLIRNEPPGSVTYADPYTTLALDQMEDPRATIQTLLPSVIDRSAWVLASPANVVDGTTRATVSSTYFAFDFPAAFLSRAKDLVFATASTSVYR